MNANDQEKHFLENVQSLLNEGAKSLDSQTSQRLEHIRLRALSAGEERRSGIFLPWRWAMVGGLATATMAAVALFFWLNTSPGDLPAKRIEDFEIITSQDRIDFYQNLEFYRWLAAVEKGPTKGKAS